jgi:hypothetical protein
MVVLKNTKNPNKKDLVILGDKRKTPESDEYEENNKIIALTYTYEENGAQTSMNEKMDYTLEPDSKSNTPNKGKVTTTLETIFNALSK